MANYANLKAQIDANIFQNDQSAITGAIMNTQLKAMVDALGAGYQYMGVATPSTNPGTTDQRVFYIASTAGTYTHFLDSNSAAIVLDVDEVAVLQYTTYWTKVPAGIANANILNYILYDKSVPFISSGGTFYIEETRVSGASIYLRWERGNLQFFNFKTGSVQSSGDFATAMAAAGLSTETSPKGVASCLKIPSGSALVAKITTTTPTLSLVAFDSIEKSDIVLAFCAGGTFISGCVQATVDTARNEVQIEFNDKMKVNKSVAFISSGGKFYIEETRRSGGSIYFRWDAGNLQIFNLKTNELKPVGEFDTVMSAAGLSTGASAVGVADCLEVPSGYALVANINSSTPTLSLKTVPSIGIEDVVLVGCAGGIAVVGCYQAAVDIVNASEYTNLNRCIAAGNIALLSYLKEIFNVSVISTLTASATQNSAILNENGGTQSQGEYKTYTYDVSGVAFGTPILISGRQGGEGSAIAAAYDSAGKVICIFYLTPRTTYTDAILFLPRDAAKLKVSSNTTPACKTASLTERSNGYIVPSYWDTLLSMRVAAINAKSAQIGASGDAFVFCTDLHWASFNYKNLPVLIRYVLEHSSITNVFCGGDIAQNGTLAEERDFYTNIQPVQRFFPTRGNHDVGDADWYSVFLKPIERFVNTNKKSYYCVDNESQKIRYIFLTTTNNNNPLDADNVAFLNAKVAEVGSGWTIVVLTHIIWEAAVASEETLQLTTCGSSVIAAVDNAVSLTNATIAAIICGHCHRDYDGTTTGGIPIIATTCDANGAQASYDPVTPTRTAGTTLEQAFDVFEIDTANRKIYTFRIGGNGDDREFSY